MTLFIDFGLSNELDKKSMLMTKCGSAEYSSPELHEGKKYGNEVLLEIKIGITINFNMFHFLLFSILLI